MIDPIPPGVDPVTHTCGCGAVLLKPWMQELGRHVLRCLKDPDHETYKPKAKETRMLSGVEVYAMSGQPVSDGQALAVADKAAALARIEEALTFGKFRSVTPIQKENLAAVAIFLGLDPVMGEIMPFQGKPLVTIIGRRRLDAEAGNECDMSYRGLTPEERADYMADGSINEGDSVGWCVLTKINGKTGVRLGTYEGLGRVLAEERTGAADLPVVKRTLEMRQKRGEMRAREQAFGPVRKTLTGLAAGIEMSNESEPEITTVEGVARIIEDEPAAQTAADRTPYAAKTEPMKQYGRCPIHDIDFVTYENKTKKGPPLNIAHKIDDEDGGGWCRHSQVLQDQFIALWTADHDDDYNKREADAWLNKEFMGTWSKMSPEDKIEAVQKQTPEPSVDTATGEMGPPPEDDDEPGFPDGAHGADTNDDGPDDVQSQEQADAEFAARQH